MEIPTSSYIPVVDPTKTLAYQVHSLGRFKHCPNLFATSSGGGCFPSSWRVDETFTLSTTTRPTNSGVSFYSLAEMLQIPLGRSFCFGYYGYL